jgi:Domain of unknown function (DUF1772)
MEVRLAMKMRRKPAGLRSGWQTAARLGQAAWFFGNLYEGLVGVPQLLYDARAQRAPGLIAPGSPIRYFAPVAPLAFGATTVSLARSFRSGGDRRLITTTVVSTASAAALSAYLIGSVNVRLLSSDNPLSDHDRYQMVATWHTMNAVRLVALAVAIASLSRLSST